MNITSKPEWLDRLYAEREWVTDRLERLQEFVDSERFDGLDREEKRRLYRQRSAMQDYVQVMTERINAANEARAEPNLQGAAHE
jgi:hypothetical protein